VAEGSAVLVWFEFGVALLVIGVAGSRLAHYGDVIGERTGLGGTWVGLMLVATVTSLPELVTSLSAVALADEPDISVGALLGSCVFNLLILAILDVLTPGTSIFARVRRGHSRAAAYGIVLIAVVALGIRFDGGWVLPGPGGVGVTTPIVFVLYVVFLRSLFQFEKQQMEVVTDAEELASPLRDAVIGYWIAAMAVVAVGLWLPFIAAEMAVVMGVHESFVGTLLVAFATSLPELVVTLAALRIGAVNMALSNIFGSNLFNLLIFVPADLFYARGPILGAVSPIQLVSAVSAIAMSALAILALRFPPRRRLLGVIGWVSIPLLAIYLANGWVLFVDGR
jgi:cation:H+ antiporter